jgi:predicted ATPase
MIKVLITGSAHAGKSTLIEKIASLGYSVVSESAQEILDEGISLHGSQSSWSNWRSDFKNERLFQEAIACRQISKEILITGMGEEIVFLDRGIYDIYAYCYLRSIEPPQVLSKYKFRYDYVFLLEATSFNPRLETGRLDSGEENEQVFRLIRSIYTERSDQCFFVPNYCDLSNEDQDISRIISARIDFIFSILGINPV